MFSYSPYLNRNVKQQGKLAQSDLQANNTRLQGPSRRHLQSPRSVSSLGASTSSNSSSAYQMSSSSTTTTTSNHYDQLRHQCPSSISSSSQGSTSATMATMMNLQQSQARPSSVISHSTSQKPTYSRNISATPSASTSTNSIPTTTNNSNNNNGNKNNNNNNKHGLPQTTSANQNTPTAGSQCPICWKFIVEREELTHLCSNCNKFICDDCASYSTNEQVRQTDRQTREMIHDRLC